jgi:hypothetical protein
MWCSQSAPWRRSLRFTVSCPSHAMQSIKWINAGPCNAREYTRASAASPPCTWYVGKANQADTSGMHVRECTQSHTQLEREQGRERNRETLRSSRGRWSRAGLTCVVTHKHTKEHTNTHTHTYKHTNSIRSVRQLMCVVQMRATHTFANQPTVSSPGQPLVSSD